VFSLYIVSHCALPVQLWKTESKNKQICTSCATLFKKQLNITLAGGLFLFFLSENM
jgi:hypothetical protein